MPTGVRPDEHAGAAAILRTVQVWRHSRRHPWILLLFCRSQRRLFTDANVGLMTFTSPVAACHHRVGFGSGDFYVAGISPQYHRLHRALLIRVMLAVWWLGRQFADKLFSECLHSFGESVQPFLH